MQRMHGEVMDTIDSQTGEDGHDMAVQSGMLKSRGNKYTPGGYARNLNVIADGPQSTRHFSTKHFSLSAQRAASRPRPVDRDTGAVKEIDQGFPAIRSPVDGRSARNAGDGKLPTIRGASFFERNFGVLKSGHGPQADEGAEGPSSQHITPR